MSRHRCRCALHWIALSDSPARWFHLNLVADTSQDTLDLEADTRSGRNSLGSAPGQCWTRRPRYCRWAFPVDRIWKLIVLNWYKIHFLFKTIGTLLNYISLLFTNLFTLIMKDTRWLMYQYSTDTRTPLFLEKMLWLPYCIVQNQTLSIILSFEDFM